MYVWSMSLPVGARHHPCADPVSSVRIGIKEAILLGLLLSETQRGVRLSGAKTHTPTQSTDWSPDSAPHAWLRAALHASYPHLCLRGPKALLLPHPPDPGPTGRASIPQHSFPGPHLT